MRENKVNANLDAVWRDDVAEAVVVVAQKLGKVVQEDQQHAEGAAVQPVNRLHKVTAGHTSGHTWSHIRAYGHTVTVIHLHL